MTEKESERRRELSRRMAEMHRDGVFRHSHIRGVFASRKAGDVYFASSFELRAMFELDTDDTVAGYQRAEAFEAAGRWRNPDLLVRNCDGSYTLMEVKPSERLCEPEVVSQIEDSLAHAKENGWGFVVWTELNSELGEQKRIISWAREFLAHRGDPQWIEAAKENSRRSSRRYHERRRKHDRIEVECPFCGKPHAILRVSHANNVARHGRYICRFEADASRKPKIDKDRPEKHCPACQTTRPREDFGLDKTNCDGLGSRCKECRRRLASIAYQKKKKKERSDAPQENAK